MQRLIESLWQQSGSTAILVTHDVDEAVALSDRIVLLEQGRAAREWLVDLPRPRDRADTAFTTLVQTILGSVMGEETITQRESFGPRSVGATSRGPER
jgi:sulfonate transport system ATP-binding protein